MAVKDVVARPVRTGGQVIVAGAITEFGDAFIYDMNEKQYAALLGLLVIVVGWIQVLVENWKGVALLREIPEAPVEPVEEAKP